MAFQVKQPIFLVDDTTGQLGYKNPITGEEIGFPKKYASAIPLIIAPTGTMANNGAITLGTALAQTYTAAYLYLPAAAIVAGSAAGWYYTVFSSTTVGTVYNNGYVSGVPTIPNSPIPFTTTGPGAYTGVTGLQAGVQIALPPNVMGPNGGVRITALYSNNNSAGSKTATLTFGGTTMALAVLSTNQSTAIYREIWNRGATNQVSTAAATIFGASNANLPAYGFAKDTTAVVTVGLSFNNGTATDWAAIEHFLVEVIPGA